MKVFRNRFQTKVVQSRKSINPRRLFLRRVFDDCSEQAHPTLKSSRAAFVL